MDVNDRSRNHESQEGGGSGASGIALHFRGEARLQSDWKVFAIIVTDYHTLSVLAQICKHNRSTGKTAKIIRMVINMSIVWLDGFVD